MSPEKPRPLISRVAIGIACATVLSSVAGIVSAGELRIESWRNDDADIWNDASECLGSTAVAVNAQRLFQCGNRNGSPAGCQAMQVSFSSAHPGIAQVVLCDGSVQRIEDSIDPAVWSSMGTRSGQSLDSLEQ